MATNTVTVVLNVKNPGHIQNQLTQLLAGVNTQTQKAGQSAGAANKAFTMMFGSGSQMAQALTSNLLGVTGAVGALGAALALVTREFQHQRDIRTEAIEPVMAHDQALLRLKNVLVDMPEDQKDSYASRLKDATMGQGMKPETAFKAAEAAISAGGDPEFALNAVADVSKLIDMNSEDNDDVAGALMDLVRFLPAAQNDSKKALGLLLKVAPTARNEQFGDFTGGMRGFAELMQVGTSPEDALALIGAASQNMSDKNLKRVSTFVSNLVRRQNETAAEVAEKLGMDFNDPELKEFREMKDPIQRAKFIAEGGDKTDFRKFMLAHVQGMAEAENDEIFDIARVNNWKQAHWGEMRGGAQSLLRGIYSRDQNPDTNFFRREFAKAKERMNAPTPNEEVFARAAAEGSPTMRAIQRQQGISFRAQGENADKAVTGSADTMRKDLNKVIGGWGIGNTYDEFRDSVIARGQESRGMPASERSQQALLRLRERIMNRHLERAKVEVMEGALDRNELGTPEYQGEALQEKAEARALEMMSEQERNIFDQSGTLLDQSYESGRVRREQELDRAWDATKPSGILNDAIRGGPGQPKPSSLPPQSSIFRFEPLVIEDPAGRRLTRARSLPRAIGNV